MESSTDTDRTLATTPAGSRQAWGLACLTCFGIHLLYCICLAHPTEVLWVCHVAAGVLGIGLLCELPTLVGIGALCLFIGTPLWAMDVLCGERLAPTSILTHGGGFLAAAVQVPRMGMAKGVWWKATIGIVLLQTICRMFTPKHLNINAAFEVYPRAAPYFSNYRLYLLATLVAALLAFAGTEWLTRRLLR